MPLFRLYSLINYYVPIFSHTFIQGVLKINSFFGGQAKASLLLEGKMCYITWLRRA